jgi:TolB-like protein
VERRGGAPAAKPAPRSARAEPLLAVLAFDNLSGDPEMAYFSDGVSEEIQDTLSRGADLKVIGRTSAFQLRGAEKTVRKAASELKATHVLDGSVRRSGQRVRVTAQLIECASETTLWSSRFDEELTDVFALQDEIAAAVAAALKVVFAPAAQAAAVEPAVYELYLKARELVAANFSDPAAFNSAIELLERATDLAPKFARAWVGLASARLSLLRYHGTEQPYAEARAKAVKAAETALALDPASAQAQLMFSYLEPIGRYAEREAITEKAFSSAPNDPEIIARMAWFRQQTGRFNDAVALTQQALDLDPMNLGLANSYVVELNEAGRYAEARDLLQRFLTLWPDALVLYRNALGAAAVAHDWQAVEGLAQLAADRGVREAVRDTLRFARNLRTLDAGYAGRFLEYARGQLGRTGNVLERDLASLCKLGLADEAFDLMERASFDYVTDAEKPWRGAFTTSIVLSPAQSIELISDARFPRLCARLGLCDYWAATDRWPDLADEGVTPYDFKAECRRLAANG